MGRTEERVAAFIVDTDARDIPDESYKAANQAVFDCLGVTLAGAAQPHGRMITRHALLEGGSGESSIIGSESKTSATMAALANGTLGHALDYDDMGGFGHPSVALFPPALALGEQAGISGRDLLTAYIIGFEVGYHLSRGAHHVQGVRGFHSTSVFGTMAATAVASRLLNLTKDETIMALGTAGSMPGGVLQNFGTYTKPLHAGMSSRNGVMAALLAKEGWLASEDIIESKVGWAASYIGEDKYDPEAMVANLGVKWGSANSIVFKKYPCCGTNHSGLDSLLGLMQEHKFTRDDVDEVEIYGLPDISHVLLYPDPAYAFQGKFSIQYNLASALVDGHVGMTSYEDSRLRDAGFRDALEKVEVKVTPKWDPEYTDHPSETPIVVRLNDGRVLRQSTNRHQMLGTPQNPLTAEQLKSKFRENAELILGEDRSEAATEVWWDLERVSNVRDAIAAAKSPQVAEI